jgi:uncharacterized protein (DUF362 family)
MSRVSITKVGTDLDAAFALALERADCVGVIKPGHRVVIKPNWNACGVEGSTKLAVVLAACRWAQAQGAGEISVGEGPVPVGREKIESYLASMGVQAALGRLGVRFVLFDDAEHVLFRDLPDLPPEIGIAQLALECDVLINIPILKVHSCCLTTLCVKNLKGCLRPADKMAFHQLGLLPAVVALNRLLPSQINVIDALEAMEGDHNRGRLVPLGLLIASRDRVAADAVGSALIGLPSGKVPLLKLAAAAGLGEHRVEKLDLVGEALVPQRLELPQDALKRHYPDLDIQDDGACSACRAALMDGLYTTGRNRKIAKIALGAQSKPAADALVLGQCLSRHFATHAHVPGCPPDGTAVARALQGETKA